MTVLAHGVGTRGDLPVPIGPAAAAAAATLVITFAALGLLWRSPRPIRPGRPLPVLTTLVDATAVRVAARFLALTVTAAVVVVGATGPADVGENPAPWWFYVLFWAGLVPASLLLGPVVRVLNPLRLLHAALARLCRIDPDRGIADLPAWVGYWPAAVSLLAFGAMELILPARAEPAAVASFVAGYAAVHVAAAVVFGTRWFARGDGFEVYSALLGSLAPLGRLPDGRLGVRNPLDGLDGLNPAPGLVGVVVVLIGTTAYDGLSGTNWWVNAVPPGAAGAALGLVGCTAAVGIVYLLGAWALVPARSRTGDRPGPAAFATTLAPIAAGYAIAHYFTLLVFDGQQALILAGDPLGMGSVDYRVVGPVTIMAVQLGAIVVGHLVATVAAHDRAVRLYPAGVALRTQFPMLGAMVALTVGAVGLLFAA